MEHQSGDGDLWHSAYQCLSTLCVEQLAPAKSHVRNIHAALRLAHEYCQLAKKKCLKFKKSDGDEVIVRDVLEKIVHWVSFFKSTGDNATQFDPPHTSMLWNAFRFILQATFTDGNMNASNKCAHAVQILELVARTVCQLRQVETLYRPHTDALQQLESVLVRTYTSILQLLASTVHAFSDPTTESRQVPLSSWDDDLKHAVLAGADQVYSLAKLIDASMLLAVENLPPRLIDVALSSQEPVGEDKYLNVTQWLSQVPHSRIHNGIKSSRVPDTGRWLLQHPDFCSWAAGSSSSQLLMHGSLGSGKTILCSAIVDDYLDGIGTTPNMAPVAYFYCSASESDRERRSTQGVLRSLAYQLTVSQSGPASIHAVLLTTYERLAEDARLQNVTMPEPSLSDSLNFILAALDDNPATIIIDALDELDEPKLLIDALDSITTRSNNVVKFFLSSRDELATSTISPLIPRIQITEDRSSIFMRSFVTHSVDRTISARRLLNGALTSPMRERIVDKLASQAGNMFRWVELQLLHLCDLNLEVQVQDALINLKACSLDDLYQAEYAHIHDRADNPTQELITRTFAWLLYMREPLNPDAFCSAVTAAVEKVPERMTAHQLVSLCRAFVHLDLHMNTVRFAHSSAQEFLRQQPALAPSAAQNILAQSCLSICSNPPPGKATKLDPCADVYHYATLYYGHHCSAIHKSDMRENLRHQLGKFLLDDNHGPTQPLSTWMDTIRTAFDSIPNEHSLKLVMELVRNETCSPLFPIVVFGLISVLEHTQWPADMNWNACNDSGHSLLYVAARRGHSNITSFLLARGASVDVECGILGSALNCAAFWGHNQVVHLLLRLNANVKVGKKFESAFHAACRGGHEDTALVILDHISGALSQADFDSCFGTALETGMSRVLERLRRHPLSESLTRLPDMGVKAIIGGNVVNLCSCLPIGATIANLVPEDAVALSALHGHKPMTAFLLCQGFGVERPGDLGTPLRCASLNGHDHVCRLLLSWGAKVNSNESLGSALYAACVNGHLKTVELLLDAGANVNIEGGFFGTCIQASAFYGHNAISSRLLAAGADPNICGYSRDAFHAAAEAGRHQTIALLLEAGFAPSPQITHPIMSVHRVVPKRNILRESSPNRLSTELNRSWRLDRKGYKPLKKQRGHDADDNHVLEAAAAFNQLQTVSAILARSTRLGLTREALEQAILAACRSGYTAAVLTMVQWNGLGPIRILAALREAASHGHMSLVLALLDMAIPAAYRARHLKVALCESVKFPLPRQEHDLERTAGMLSQCPHIAAMIERGDVVSLLRILDCDIDQGRLFEIMTKSHSSGKLAAFMVVKEVLKLHLGDASEEVELHVLQRLLAFYAERASDEEVQAMIMVSAARGHIETVSLLINLPGRILLDAQLTLDRALGFAARNGQADACLDLICKGADPTRGVTWDQGKHIGQIPKPPMLPEDNPPTGNALQSCIAGYDRFHGWEKRNGSLRGYWNEGDEQAQNQTMLVLLDSIPTLESPSWAKPMCMAVQYCSARVVSDMLDRGVPCNGGESVLTCAVQRDAHTLPVLEVLLQDVVGQRQTQDDTQGLLNTALQHFCLGELLPDTDNLQDVFVTGPGAAVEYLLQRLPNQRAEGVEYNVLLECAAAAGRASLVRLLIQRHVQLNARGSYYGNALQAASRFGHVDIVKQLLDAGADPNTVRGRYYTALIAAVQGSHAQVVKVLLGAGAVPEPDEKHHNFLSGERVGMLRQLAEALQQNLDLAQVVVSAGSIDFIAAAPHQAPLLIQACSKGHVLAVKTLLAAGADVHEVWTSTMSSQPQSPVHAAIKAGNPEVLRNLLSNGLDLAHDFSPLEAPLISAVRHYNRVVFDVLLQAMYPVGADALRSATLEAMKWPQVEVVERLIGQGAVIIDPDRNVNMLAEAFKSGNVPVLASLLEHASGDGNLEHGLESICRHLWQGNAGVIQLILNYMPCSVDIFAAACALKYEAVVRIGLEQGLSADTVHVSGWPVLHLAAAAGSASVVRLLLQHKADVGNSCGSPLRAALEGYCVIDLLQRELPEDAQAYAQSLCRLLHRASEGDQRWTWRLMALRPCQHEDYERVVDVLLAHGAVAETEPGYFGTALTLAAYAGQRRVFDRLMDSGARLSARGGLLESPLAAAIEASRQELIQDMLQRGPGVEPETLIAACRKSTLDTVEMVLKHPASPFGRHVEANSPSTPSWEMRQPHSKSTTWHAAQYILELLLDTNVPFSISGDDITQVTNQTDEKLRNRVLPKMFSRMETPHFPDESFIRLLNSSDWCRPDADLVKQLLDQKRIRRVTAPMLRAAPDIAAMRQLLDYDPNYRLTADDADALGHGHRPCSRGMFAFLLQRESYLVPRESNVVTFLGLPGDRYLSRDVKAQNDPDALKMLFGRNSKLTITGDMLKAARDPDLLQFLLDWRNSGDHGVIQAAITDFKWSDYSSERMLWILIDADPSVSIPAATATQYIRARGFKALERLWQHDAALMISEEALVHLAEHLQAMKKYHNTPCDEFCRLLDEHKAQWQATDRLQKALDDMKRQHYEPSLEDF